MMIGRWLVTLLAIMLLTGCAAAEEIKSEADLTATSACVPEDMKQEDIQAFVEAMFAAAVGTDVEHENRLRMDMTEEEILERNAADADYRAGTLPWLIAAFRPETGAEDTKSADVQIPEPTVIPTTEPALLPVYTIEDSFAAFADTESGEAYLAQMESFGGTDMETCLKITQEICGMWMAQVDHAALSEMNGDYRCWIYAPDTQIDYPVVQCGDNSHYLKRMLNGERNSAGTLFIDYRNLPDFQDPNTLIYGHHMRNDSMFGTLTDYAEQAYYEGHPIMLLMTPDEIFLLEIFAGYTTSDQDHCYDIAISDEEDMADFIESAVRKSDFVSGVQVQTTDRLVTLSTCTYAFEDARYILIGRIEPVYAGRATDQEGVYRRKSMSIQIGHRVGRLKVLEATDDRKSGYTVWRCKCDCGGEILLDTRRLQRETIKDCGCQRKVRPGQKDLTGRRFGRLTAIEPTEERAQKVGRSGSADATAAKRRWL